MSIVLWQILTLHRSLSRQPFSLCTWADTKTLSHLTKKTFRDSLDPKPRHAFPFEGKQIQEQLLWAYLCPQLSSDTRAVPPILCIPTEVLTENCWQSFLLARAELSLPVSFFSLVFLLKTFFSVYVKTLLKTGTDPKCELHFLDFFSVFDWLLHLVSQSPRPQSNLLEELQDHSNNLFIY